jgi:S-DNA-T family DNA segregation ATPase FtsK/SpoIIIE
VGEALYYGASTLLADVGAHILAVFLLVAGVLLLTGASVAGVMRATATKAADTTRSLRRSPGRWDDGEGEAGPESPDDDPQDEPAPAPAARRGRRRASERLLAPEPVFPPSPRATTSSSVPARSSTGRCAIPTCGARSRRARARPAGSVRAPLDDLAPGPRAGARPEPEPEPEPERPAAHAVVPVRAGPRPRGPRRRRGPARGGAGGPRRGRRRGVAPPARGDAARPLLRRERPPGHGGPGGDRRSAHRGPAALQRRGEGRRDGRRPAHHPLRAAPGARREDEQGRGDEGRPGLRAGGDGHPHPRPDPGQAGRGRRGPQPQAQDGHARRRLRRGARGLEPADRCGSART